MQNHSTHKSASGFTLIELLTSMAIIGVLAAVAIQQYSLYKIRGYDAHSKQALHDINLLCNAYWTENYISDECDLAKSKEYGFVQHSDVVATLPSSPLDTFCASAKHNSSPNTYSIDSAALISLGGNCSGAGGSVQTASVSPAHTFKGYTPPAGLAGCNVPSYINYPPKGAWVAVDSNGRSVQAQQLRETSNAEHYAAGIVLCTCNQCKPGGSWHGEDGLTKFPRPNNYKYVFVSPIPEYTTGNMYGEMMRVNEQLCGGRHAGNTSLCKNVGHRYNFETGMWINNKGEKFKNGNLVD